MRSQTKEVAQWVNLNDRNSIPRTHMTEEKILESWRHTHKCVIKKMGGGGLLGSGCTHL